MALKSQSYEVAKNSTSSRSSLEEKTPELKRKNNDNDNEEEEGDQKDAKQEISSSNSTTIVQDKDKDESSHPTSDTKAKLLKDLDKIRKIRESSLHKIEPNEEVYLLSAHEDLKVSVSRSSCLYTLYTMGVVDPKGNLLIFESLKSKYSIFTKSSSSSSSLLLKAFPRNILSFDIYTPDEMINEEGTNELSINEVSSSMNHMSMDHSNSSSSNISNSSSSMVCLESNIRDPPAPFQCLTRELNLSRQINLIEMINLVVDELRNVDRPLRTEVLKINLAEINRKIESGIYYDPIEISGEPVYKLVRIIIDDCRVFRTKARAPSMIVYEVAKYYEENSNTSNNITESLFSSSSSSSSSITNATTMTTTAGNNNSQLITKPPKPPICDEEEVGNILGSKLSQTLGNLRESEIRRQNDKSDLEDDFEMVSHEEGFIFVYY